MVIQIHLVFQFHLDINKRSPCVVVNAFDEFYCLLFGSLKRVNLFLYTRQVYCFLLELGIKARASGMVTKPARRGSKHQLVLNSCLWIYVLTLFWKQVDSNGISPEGDGVISFTLFVCLIQGLTMPSRLLSNSYQPPDAKITRTAACLALAGSL